MSVGFMYLHLTVSVNVYRQVLFNYLKDQNANLILVFIKKTNLWKMCYNIFLKLFLTDGLKMKIL